MVGIELELVDWFIILELMIVYDKYFFEEEFVCLLMYQKSQVGDVEWIVFVVDVCVLYDVGVFVEDECVCVFVVCWMVLLVCDMNNDLCLFVKLNLMYEYELLMQLKIGILIVLCDYVLCVLLEMKMWFFEKYFMLDEICFMCVYYVECVMEWLQLMVDVCDVIDVGMWFDLLYGCVFVQCWFELFCSYVGYDLVMYVKFCYVLMNELVLMKDLWIDDMLFGFVCEVMVQLVLVC